MICKMCHKPFYVPATEIKISNCVDNFLNRTIRTCPKCAYSIVEKCIETEPFNKKNATKDKMKRPPKKWKCKDGMKTPEQMNLEELKILLKICNKFNECCGWNDEAYNQQLWINEAEKVQNLINQKEK